MLPYLGAGGGAGIEDAYVLSQLLAHPLTNASNIQVRHSHASSH
jgi:salicylate hydroxylase